VISTPGLCGVLPSPGWNTSAPRHQKGISTGAGRGTQDADGRPVRPGLRRRSAPAAGRCPADFFFEECKRRFREAGEAGARDLDALTGCTTGRYFHETLAARWWRPAPIATRAPKLSLIVVRTWTDFFQGGNDRIFRPPWRGQDTVHAPKAPRDLPSKPSAEFTKQTTICNSGARLGATRRGASRAAVGATDGQRRLF